MGRPRNDARRQELQRRFLAAFAKYGVITRAAEEAGIPAPTHHRWFRHDEEYACRFTEIRDVVDPSWRNKKKSGVPEGFKYTTGPVAERRAKAQDDFLVALAQTGSLTKAWHVSGVSPITHFTWLHSNEDYARRVHELDEVRDRVFRQSMRQNALDTNAKRKPTKHEAIVKSVLDELDVEANFQDDHTGRYALDFFVPSLKMVIEVDSYMHVSGTDYRRSDAERDAWLTEHGYRIYRIRHAEIDDGTFIPRLTTALGLA